MPKTPETVQTAPAAADEKNSNTAWRAFEKAKLVPASITCTGYPPAHPSDLGCHTRLPLVAETILNHIREHADHNGGLQIKVRESDRVWTGWAAFEAAGLEASDFRCEVCDKKIPFHPNHIRRCFKDHPGKLRRSCPGGIYNLTVGFDTPVPSEDDAFEMAG